MNLPTAKVSIPHFELTIPSTGEKITYRPFLAKEHKLLLLALESEEESGIFNITKRILQDCIITPGIDVTKLASFDLEYIFLQLRAKSIGETIKQAYECPEIVNGEECKGIIPVFFDITDVKVQTKPEHTKKIFLEKDLGLIMKYPTINDIESRKIYDIENDTFFDVIIDCIDAIFDDQTVYKDSTREELREFIESFPMEYMEKIYQFFETMPSLTHKIDAACKKCGYKHEVVLEGLPSFFG